MRISGLQPQKQPVLFDTDEYRLIKGNHGLIRTVIGDFFEDATAEAINGRRHKTDSRCDYCPDVSNGSTFCEVKAVGKSKQVLIYKGRLERDLEFSADHKLVYFVWQHSLATTLYETVSELRGALRHSIVAAYVVPFMEVYRACKATPLTPLNSKYGGSNSRVQYGSGYRVNISRFKGFEHV